MIAIMLIQLLSCCVSSFFISNQKAKVIFRNRLEIKRSVRCWGLFKTWVRTTRSYVRRCPRNGCTKYIRSTRWGSQWAQWFLGKAEASTCSPKEPRKLCWRSELLTTVTRPSPFSSFTVVWWGYVKLRLLLHLHHRLLCLHFYVKPKLLLYCNVM